MNTITHDIFVHLIPSKELTNLFRKQVKGQRGLKMLTLVSIGCVIWSEVERRKQEEQIYQLSGRVKKLERGEGE